jgi:ketol-acid reductoisomerase
MAPEPVRKAADKALEEIESGAFAREWTREQEEGLPELSRLWKQAEAHPINAAESRLSDLRAIVARADET